MGLGGFTAKEAGKQDFATVVIDGGDQGPFLLGLWTPQVGRAIPLDQGSDRGRQYFPIVYPSRTARLVAIQLLRPIDDGGHRYLDSFGLQPVPDGRVAAARNG